ncbi:dihydrolipoyl dehydrogenase [Marinobacter sp.]|uniref:dihydrolipoyl dehydrogenase n=1 Tax=Marinobacter sp. TaxID=50741 RepID=UPI003850F89E
MTTETDVLVIGAGPGGYAAAFRAADLGLKVTLVSEEETLGGVCLLRGCIPSKTLLQLTELIHESREAKAKGIDFGKPEVDIKGLREWKNQVIDTLTKGLDGLCKTRGVNLVFGRARFRSSSEVDVETGEENQTLSFGHAIIATGSRPVAIRGIDFAESRRILDSTGALELPEIPKRLLVVGGGYVGLEMGTVYAALGTEVSLVEMTDRLMGNVDRDLLKPLQKRLEKEFKAIHLNTRVEELEESDGNVKATLEGEESGTQTYDYVLVAISRKPNTDDLGLKHTDVELDDDGFIQVDEQRHTADKAIYAIGDCAGGMLLAHEAMAEGRVAAEVIAGEASAFDARAVPAVVYTDPQIAWCGLTEQQAEEQGVDVEIAHFPWKASGRALSMGSEDGLTKLILAADTQRILGVGIVGRQAETLIAEGVLAVEMGAVAEDLALSVHPHPTLSETLGEAAQAFLGGAVHLPGSDSRRKGGK